MRVTGLEPAQPCDHKNLNLTRLPIPPYPHIKLEVRLMALHPTAQAKTACTRYDTTGQAVCQAVFKKKDAIFFLLPPIRQKALYKGKKIGYNILHSQKQYAPVAQLDRVSDSDSEGRAFESHQA